MFSKKYIHYIIFSAFVILNQSFQCEDQFNEGIFELSITVNDERNNPIPNILLGLISNETKCLLDTFYTDQDGKRDYTYIKEKDNFNVFNTRNSITIIQKGMAEDQIDINAIDQEIVLQTQFSKKLLNISLPEHTLDSIQVYTHNLPILVWGQCENNLRKLPRTLDYFLFTKETPNNHIFNVLPNFQNNIRVIGFENDSIVLNTQTQILVNEEITEHVINL